MKKIQLLSLIILFITKINAQDIPYNSADATINIQTAINNAPNDAILHIRYQGVNNPWRISQIIIDDSVGTGIILEIDPEVIITAENDVIYTNASDAFNSGLFQIENANGFTINGNGATIKRPKAGFIAGEWANTFTIISSNNIILKNLILEESGGDGIYIGSKGGNPVIEAIPSSNIVIDNLTINDVVRNAISVTNINGLSIKNCTLKNTGLTNSSNPLLTTGPFSGIDFEPNLPWQVIQNINVENNKILSNSTSGIAISLGNLKDFIEGRLGNYPDKHYEHDISININNNYIYGTELDNEGILLGGIKHNNFDGYINFNNNTIKNTRKGVRITNVLKTDSLNIKFNNTLFDNAAKAKDWSTIFFDFDENTLLGNSGGITFNNTHVVNNISSLLFTFKINSNTSPYLLTFEDLNFNDFYLDNSSSYDITPRAGVNYSATSTLNKKTLEVNKNPQIVFGDFNNDHRTDYFVKNEDLFRGLYLAENNNNGKSFVNIFSGIEDSLGGTDTETFFSSNDAKMYPGDYNGDGKTDLFINGLRYQQNYIRALYLANSSGNGFKRIYFSNNEDISILNSGNPQIFTGDFAGDSNDDILIINPTHSTIKSTLLLSNSNISVNNSGFDVIDNVINDSNFISKVSIDSQIHIGNFNGDADHKLGLFIKDYTSNKYRSLFTSNIDNTFKKEFDAFGSSSDGIGGTDYELFFSSNDAKIYTGDYNNDGKTDLFLKGYLKYKGLYLSVVDNLTGNFIEFNRVFMDDSDANNTYGLDSEDYFTHEDAKVYKGDFDGNGTTDLFVNGYQNYRQLYLAELDANNEFSKFKRVFKENHETEGFSGVDNDSLFSSLHTKIFTGKFNDDNRTDLLVKGNNNFIGVYLANESGNGFNSFISEENEEINSVIHYDWCFDNSVSNFNQKASNVKSVDVLIENDILTYPNPTNGSIFIKSPFIVENISVYDLSGRLILKDNIKKTEFQLNINELPQGVYLLEFNGIDNKITKKTVIKN